MCVRKLKVMYLHACGFGSVRLYLINVYGEIHPNRFSSLAVKADKYTRGDTFKFPMVSRVFMVFHCYFSISLLPVLNSDIWS